MAVTGKAEDYDAKKDFEEEIERLEKDVGEKRNEESGWNRKRGEQRKQKSPSEGRDTTDTGISKVSLTL